MKNKWKFFSLMVVLSTFLYVGCDQAMDSTIVGTDALSAYQIASVNGDPTSCADLLAGQTIPAGSVCYEVVGDNMIVTFNTSGGWELEEAHLWVGDEPDGYPQGRNGNPKIGNFEFNSGDITGATSFSFTVDLTQFNLDPSLCDPGNFLYSMAHAAVRKGDGTGGYQTETGWADGDPSGAKNWSTVVSLELKDDSCGGGGPGNKCFDEETAYGYDEANATCFSEFGELVPNPSRWGWSNGAYGYGTYDFIMYAGAGSGGSADCVITNANGSPRATNVGTATLTYNEDGTASVTYSLTGGWILETTHVYIGNDLLAKNNQGEFTLAPGQYGSTNDFDPQNGSTASLHSFSGLSGDVFVVIHAAVLKEVVCVD